MQQLNEAVIKNAERLGRVGTFCAKLRKGKREVGDSKCFCVASVHVLCKYPYQMLLYGEMAERSKAPD